MKHCSLGLLNAALENIHEHGSRKIVDLKASTNGVLLDMSLDHSLKGDLYQVALETIATADVVGAISKTRFRLFPDNDVSPVLPGEAANSVCGCKVSGISILFPKPVIELVGQIVYVFIVGSEQHGYGIESGCIFR